ncbi:NAD(P)H-dependent oxidoreductase [Fodinibius saliphilus]|uniref:NAD(P)H-dependent oxidoreductase n=1 Tax=Fodinibius saliphilus TaxID=1920650 RepID=UPI001108E6E1|nr:Gfo/Idh/MocA family oxidoreductase [Fodinibius saliphilus]
MIIVDNALKERERSNNPVRVGIIGAGYMGRGTVLTIERSVPGMKVAALYNRTLSKAKRAFSQAGVDNYREVSATHELDQVIAEGGYAVTDNPNALCRAENLDVIIEATGQIEFGAQVTVEAINHQKHVVLMNAELDATVGPILKKYADDNGVIITNADGDQPGVLMNLMRFVKTIGYDPVLAGNIKGLEDPYRTPETQKEFARKHKQKPRMVTSFADGTKLSMEMAVVANATGFKAGKRGMYGPECEHATDAIDLFPMDQMMNGGLVDYILGAEPGPGVFVLAYNDNPIQQDYMSYFKMGDGPLYVFYVPYHLPHLEVPITAARAVLFNDATIAPKGEAVCDVITLAKKDLKAGDMLDGIGGFTTYGTLENSDIVNTEAFLPMGLSEGCVLKNDVPKDHALTYQDVTIPKGRLVDQIRREQMQYFDFTKISNSTVGLNQHLNIK